MAQKACTHSDVREFDGLRTCLACGETRFRDEASQTQDASEERQYLYTDLRCLEQGQTIRLIVLAPGNYDDPIHCTLVLSGVHHSEYEAVSYTWATEDGDASKSHEVHVDGDIFQVTQNCHAALRQLRHTESHRRLWIDAICINQQNVHERNHQVGIMDRIYQGASQVLICIHDTAHSYSNAMKWLSGRAGPPPETDATGHDEVQTLLNRRYFGRVWVIQEIVLARRLILYVNNDHAELTRNVLLNLQRRNRLQGSLRVRLEFGVQRDLHEYMKLSLSCQCSEPRDYVYAILSLLDAQTRDLIPVDYTLSIEQIYQRLVVAYIATTNTMYILRHAATVVTSGAFSAIAAFSVSQFQDFLLSDKASQQLNKDLIRGPVGYCQRVRLFDQSTHERTSKFQPQFTSVRRQQVMPRFWLRAHFIDTCEKVRSQSAESVKKICEDLAEHFKNGVPGLPFDKSRLDFMPKAALADGNELLLVERLRYLYLGGEFYPYVLDTRFSIGHGVMRAQTGDHIAYPYDFGTKFGVGQSVVQARPGDRIAYLDGVSVQMLLRPYDASRYRVISACWWHDCTREKQGPCQTQVIQIC